MPSDSERLDKLERILREGTLIWDGRGAFPGEGLPRLGLSIMAGQEGERSIREMIDAVTDPGAGYAGILAEPWEAFGLETRALNGVIAALEREHAGQVAHEELYRLPLSAVLALPGVKSRHFGPASFRHLIAFLRRRGVPLEVIQCSPLWFKSPARFRKGA